jgi:hypothetical protein
MHDSMDDVLKKVTTSRSATISPSIDLVFPPEVAEGAGSFTLMMPSGSHHHRLWPMSETEGLHRICNTRSPFNIMYIKTWIAPDLISPPLASR